MKRMSLSRKMVLCGLVGFLPFAALYVAPLFMTLWYSVMENSFSMRFVGLMHYREVWGNEYFHMGLQNTFLISLASVGCNVALLLGACFFGMYLPASAARVLILLCIPYFAPSASMAAVWRGLFGATLFSSDAWLRFSIGCMFLWKYSGVCILMLTVGIRQIPPEYLEAAEIDGAGRLRRYLFIALPMCRQILSLLLLLMLAYALRLYREDYLLYGEYPVDGVYLLQHYLINHFRKLHYPTVAAGTVIFVGLCGGIYALMGLLGPKRRREEA